MWKKIKEFNDWYIENKNVFEGVFKILVIGFVLLCFAITLKNTFKQAPKPVTPMTQLQAEASAGVEKAADNAGIKLQRSQAKEAAEEIRYIYEIKKEPAYIVNTTGEKAPAAASEARKEAKADFAIITDRNNPDKQVQLEELKKDQPVELNQYNVQAYKPVIRTVTISPDIEGKKLEQINFSISKKINKKGEYIGVGAGYDIINKRTLLNISYTW